MLANLVEIRIAHTPVISRIHMFENAEETQAVFQRLEYAQIHAYDGRKRQRERGVGLKSRIKQMRRHCLHMHIGFRRPAQPRVLAFCVQEKAPA